MSFLLAFSAMINLAAAAAVVFYRHRAKVLQDYVYIEKARADRYKSFQPEYIQKHVEAAFRQKRGGYGRR